MPKTLLNACDSAALPLMLSERREVRGRSACPHRSAANALSTLPRSEKALEGCLELAKEYAAACHGMRVVLHRPTVSHLKEVCFVQGKTTWDRKHVRGLIGRIEGAHIRPGPCYFLTLTIVKREDRSPREDFRLCQEAWNVLLTEMRRRLGGVQYIRTWEVGKGNTNVHAHILIRPMRFEPKRTLGEWIARRWYELTGATEGKLEVCDREHALAYIVKYIRKGLLRLTRERALLWACGVRVFAASQGLLPTEPPQHEWELWGYLFGVAPGEFLPGSLYIEWSPDCMEGNRPGNEGS